MPGIQRSQRESGFLFSFIICKFFILSILGLAAMQRRVPGIGSLNFFELPQAGLMHPAYHLATNRVCWQSVAGFDNSGFHDVFETIEKARIHAK